MGAHWTDIPGWYDEAVRDEERLAEKRALKKILKKKYKKRIKKMVKAHMEGRDRIW